MKDTNDKEVKEGDVVIQYPGRTSGSCCSCHYGKEYTIQKTQKGLGLGIGEKPEDLCTCVSCWTLIKNNHSFIMNLTQSFKAIFRTEPAKTFVKAGITNENGDMTSEGQTIFLSYLLQIHGDAFKKDIVDEILKEEKASKN